MPKQQLPAALAEARRVVAAGGVLAVTVKAGTTEGFEPNRSGTWLHALATAPDEPAAER